MRKKRGREGFVTTRLSQPVCICNLYTPRKKKLHLVFFECHDNYIFVKKKVIPYSESS